MLVLVVDTSTPAVTAALAEVTAEEVVLRAERVTVDGRAHGELLAPGDRGGARRGRRGRDDLAAVVAGVGPRAVHRSAGRAGHRRRRMGHALGIPAYGVCSLDALGARRTAGPVLVATDARRTEVYWAVYDDGVRGRRARGRQARRRRRRRRRAGRDASAVGEGAAQYADVLGLPVPASRRYPPADALAELAADRVRADAPGEPLTPLYLRRPDAVEPAAGASRPSRQR